MSEENTAVTNTATAEPEDDATVVHDEAEEKAHDELVTDVTKLLDKTPAEDKPDEPQPGEEKPPKGEESEAESTAKPKDEEPALSDELQVRAEGAGISEELAQRLHQSGQLEETIAAFDRTLIERFQSKETEGPEKSGKARDPDRREKPPRKESEATDDEAPDLDPDVYDEGLVKRDAHHKRRIDALESQLAELLQHQQSAFNKGFDGMVDGLGHKDLFGTGDSVPKAKQANRVTLLRAYEAVCMMHDVDPTDCDPQWGKRALAAMFPNEVFKKVQRQTVDRLRDAEGKFLPSSKPRGAPPAKEMTEEENDQYLVAKVRAYGKEQGIQWG